MCDIKDGKINVVICYRIDRISRNVLDFSNFYSTLSSYSVAFVSIKEQIDTSTPLGRAMMYICSVFAQMERETIAERVTDNMIALSKSGKWTGGKAPIGYNLGKIEANGKTHTILIKNEIEIPFLTMIFDTFLEGYSLNGLENNYREKNIKTLNDKFLSGSQLYSILKNPHYAPADVSTLNYFKNLGCTIGCDEIKFDGKFGIVAYGRTTGGNRKKHTANTPEKWIISVGMHEPLLSSEKWIAVQKRFGINTINKTRKHKIGILKGVLRCSCGYLMRVQHKVDTIYHKTYDNYFCQNRNRRGIDYCDRQFTPVNELDNAVINIFKSIKLDKSIIDNYVYEDKGLSISYRSSADVQKDIDKIQTKIANLTSVLSTNSTSSAAKYIIEEMEQLDQKMVKCKFELMDIEKIESKRVAVINSKQDKYKMVCQIVDCLDIADYDEINEMIRDLIKECTFDGLTLKIKI